mgnify:FL=1
MKKGRAKRPWVELSDIVVPEQNPGPERYDVPNFRSLIALKSCTPPPTRLVV